MDENEQIEEIAKVLCADYGNCEGCPFAVLFIDYYTCDRIEKAERVVLEKGYRKVERGEWIEKTHDWDFGDYIDYTCSICGSREQNKRNFCPECGADMRGKEE